MTIVEWTIPDISRKLNDRIKREAYRTNEIIIKHEMNRAKVKNRQGGKVRTKLDSMNMFFYKVSQ